MGVDIYAFIHLVLLLVVKNWVVALWDYRLGDHRPGDTREKDVATVRAEASYASEALLELLHREEHLLLR